MVLNFAFALELLHFRLKTKNNLKPFKRDRD